MQGIRVAEMKTSDENIVGDIFPGNGLGISKENRSESAFASRQEDLARARRAGVPPEQIEKEVIELSRRHAASLARYAASLARDTTVVQDALQEAFLRYFIARVDGQQIENPRAWLFRVLRNYLLDCSRKRISGAEVDLECALGVPDARQDVESEYQRAEIFRRALSTLSPRERECTQMRLEGFDYKEIAHILGIGLGTVGALLARGFHRMREACLLGRGLR
jgi:RNA polymerase sigma-70 factor, ECF subfamily